MVFSRFCLTKWSEQGGKVRFSNGYAGANEMEIEEAELS